MSRRYVPYPEKHKWPKGYGSRCPKMTDAEANELLQQAVSVEGAGANKLWTARGRWCFCAHPSPHAGADAWHGFPVIGADVEDKVLIALQEAGVISKRDKNRLRRQRELPGDWP